MPHLADLLALRTELAAPASAHLARLVEDWQLVADLSFADLLLWVRVGSAPLPTSELMCVAQVRPTTGSTSQPEDRVGQRIWLRESFELTVAFTEERICREADPDWSGEAPVRQEAIPVRYDGQVIAVMSRATNLAAARSPSALEFAYLQAAGDLCQMIAEGAFPYADEDAGTSDGPRVGDGFIRLGPDGIASYASPNALSAYRRLGVTTEVRGADFAELSRGLAGDPFEGEEIGGMISSAVAGGASPRMEGAASPRMEIEAAGAATVLLRALPLVVSGDRRGALVLVRDVTDVRHRDRQLMSKDATIREIHHRVKNNLQTVAALLRLQARRVDVPEAREALGESVRRVASIALVHETLAQSLDEQVEFDGIVDRLLGMVADVTTPESSVRLSRDGEFGELGAQVATPLVMVLTELLQNAVEHAFPDGPGSPLAPGGHDRTGSVVVRATRSARELSVSVRDDGVGLPAGFDIATTGRLGLQIVKTLVFSELRGSIAVERLAPHGTLIRVQLPLVSDGG